MPSQFFGLNIAYKGLTAAQIALNTTNNNISNLETDGYSRQRVKQQAADALRTFTTYGCAGAGVDVIAIERIRDEFYDVKYWNNNQRLGEYEVKNYYMKQLEDMFADNNTSRPGFNTIFSQFNKALDEIKKPPGGTDAKTQFVGDAQSLADYFNEMMQSLENTQKDCNDEIKLRVDTINTIASKIAMLNKQINTVEVSGIPANELRDQRTVLLDQLSAIVDIEVKETKIVDPTYPDMETGGTRFTIKIAGGQTLVSTNDYNELECIPRKSNEKVNQSDIDGLYDIQWSNGMEFALYNESIGGELQSLIEMRDGNNQENFSGNITDVDGKEVTIHVTADYLTDMSKCKLSDTGGKILLGNQEFVYESWKYDPDTQSYTFTLSDEYNDRMPSTDRVGGLANVGASIDYQGVPYYMAQMNEWVRNFAQKFNEILTGLNGGPTYDSEGNVAENDLFVANNLTDGTQQKCEAVAGEVNPYDPAYNGYFNMTAKNFGVAKELVDDASKLAVSTSATEGESAYDVIEALIKFKSDKDQMSFRGCSAGEFLQCILSDVALNAKRANTFYENYNNLSTSIENQRLSVSGVDADEEALNIVKFQNAFNLSSKMVQTLTEIYDRLILQTGV